VRRLTILLILCVAGAARADDVVLDAATPAEKALMPLLAAGQLIKARTAAEAILATSKDSFVATWAMALIQHNEESNHARALFHVRRAEQLLLAKYPRDPEWHKRVLDEEHWILLEMNRNAEAIAVLDKIDSLYGTTDPARRIWPLFKIGRADESREIARKLAESDDFEERLAGYNGMLSIEFEAHNREACYRWSIAGVRATQERSCTILRNAAGAAFTHFKLREAEELALKAHKADSEDCTFKGYDQLAGVYLAMGELQKAISAIETLKGQPVQKRYRSQFSMVRRYIVTDLLSILGKVDDAARMAAELYAMPDRTGMVSTAAMMERFVRSYRYWMALDTKIILERERRSFGPLFDLPSPADLSRVLTQWEIRRALIQLAADSDMLVTLVRPNLGEINEFAAWKTGGLIRVLGTGVLRAAVAEARRLDAEYPDATAYLDAVEGEIAFDEGRYGEAERLAKKAIEALPREEVLLRWRTQAWLAEAIRRQGRVADARPYYHELLQKLPSALRFVDARVPATVNADGSARGEAAAKRLRRSTRFVDAGPDAPFRLHVTDRAGALEICLTDDRGFQLACGTGEKRDDEDEALASGLEKFHAAAFSPKVSLKQTDLQSLDGTPVRVGADEVLKGVLSP
jgi:tetratricopeptide (TPR) repeat protein